jgi:putative heme-binding domain-containing protein
LTGPFTVETWVKLSPGIDNRDGILGGPGVADMNFHAGQFRVWIAGGHDMVVARSRITPQAWTHCAVTRDAAGTFRVYVNGQLDAESSRQDTRDLPDLNVGRTLPDSAGTDGQLAELRVWNVERTADEIRNHFDRGLDAEPRPEGLVHRLTGSAWGSLHGNARIEATFEGPRLLSSAEAQAQDEKFARFRTLAASPGDLSRGRAVFAQNCLKCHTQGGNGGRIGPALDGVGLAGTETLLRHMLTPSAAMEGGYRNYRVVTRDGRVLQGMLVAEDETAVVLRRPDTSDQRIPRAEIDQSGHTSQSIMPDGLLESLEPQNASDLITYLLSLKQGLTQ